MQKISTMRTSGKNIFQGQLTIGLDLGDRSSAYCVLNEAGGIVLEHKLATTPEAMKQVFGSLPRCRIAMETGTHSPWVSRELSCRLPATSVARAEPCRYCTRRLSGFLRSLEGRGFRHSDLKAGKSRVRQTLIWWGGEGGIFTVVENRQLIDFSRRTKRSKIRNCVELERIWNTAFLP